jgi:diacylglycerol kinase family enzyme
MRYFFIINPQSRNGRSVKKNKDLFSLLQKTGLSFDHAFTDSLDHAYVLSEKANKDRYDAVVAVGGDGTINRVLNGFFNAEGRRISSTRMGVIHTGTSPDFCMSYGIPQSLESAVHVIAAGKTSLVRVGRIECAALPAGAEGKVASPPRFFGCCANVGLGAAVARTSNGGIRRFAGDRLGTFLSLLKALIVYRPVTLSLTIDGNRRISTRVYNIAVGKTRFIASGIRVQHTLGPSDQGFYIVNVRDLTPFNFIPVLGLLYRDKPIPAGCSYISLEYGSRIEISCKTPLETEFDGDPAGYCPCTVTTAADPLELMIGESHAV